MSNFDVPPTRSEKTNNENFEPVFTLELRKKLSDSFMKFLNERKIPDQENIRLAREIIGVPEDYLTANKDLSIFRNALYDLIQDPDFPNCKEKITLKIFLQNLNTISLMSTASKLNEGNLSSYDISQLNDPISNPISGLESYGNAVSAILSTLEDVLTPEVNLAIHAYSNKIFLTPLNQAINS